MNFYASYVLSLAPGWNDPIPYISTDMRDHKPRNTITAKTRWKQQRRRNKK